MNFHNPILQLYWVIQSNDFYYNKKSKENVKKKKSITIGGNKSLSFDTIEYE